MIQLDFDKGGGLMPCVVQHAHTGVMLMLGYMNREAYDKTVADGYVWFYSRSKKRLWMKGETSGNKLRLQEIGGDCDGDALLALALPLGPTCHLGNNSCFEREPLFSKLLALEEVIQNKAGEDPTISYTAELIANGQSTVAQKVGEEAVETVVALCSQTQDRVVSEAADLIYHLLVALHVGQVKWRDVMAELDSRKQSSGKS